MPRKTQVFQMLPWVGGVNTSVDPGVLNPQELVQADNVVFTNTGARIKREALSYFDHEVPSPDLRSSSGTTRTLKWTTTSLVNISIPDERLVTGERVTVTGNTNYNASNVPITAVEVPQVTTVQCVADVADSLAGKYFLISAGDSGTDYYVWYKVSGSGTDPAVAGRTGLEVDISTNDTADDVATATKLVLDAEDDFDASVVTNTVTITNELGGLTTDGDDGTSGFTVTITTKGGHTVSYTVGASLSEAETTAAGISVARASSIIAIRDYWRWNGQENTQLLLAATDSFQLFRYDSSGRRTQVLGQEQVTEVTVLSGGAITTGQHFFLWSASNETKYYVWYNVDGGGGDPAPSGATAIPVAISSGDSADQVATATAAAIDAVSDFEADAAMAIVTITNVSPGVTNQAEDVDTGFDFVTVSYGATAPTDSVSTVKIIVFQEDAILFFSGLGNYPITYNPDDNPKYQLLSPTAPDASFGFEHLGRLWTNNKSNTDRLEYSETFDPTLWGGIGDSGALDVGVGDGDPEGITNGYKYKGFLVAGKKANRYRIVGDAPENFLEQAISNGLGNEGALSIAVDESDVVFMSRRGIHSQAATDTYGDTGSAFLSKKIKPTFDDFEPARLKFSQGEFIPELNSIAFSISEDGHSSNNAVWLYNIEVTLPSGEKGAWYRWPNVSCQALSRRLENGRYRLVFGTNAGRIVQAQTPNEFADFGTDGIAYMVKTGTIYVDENPQTMKGFKRISMFYRPSGSFSFAVGAKIDNFSSQGFSFTQTSGADLLGETFILGESLLGSVNTLAPYTFIMDGYGRGVSLTITQPTADEQIELWGMAIEYENADLQQETV